MSLAWLGLGPGLATEVLVVVAVGLGALTQAGTGMGFSLLAAPVLIAVLGPQQGVGTVLVLAVLASVVPLTREWRHARPGDVARLLVPTLVCTPLVALAVRSVDTRWVALASGVGVLAGVALLASGVRWSWLRLRRGAFAAGLSSAVLNVTGGVGGPPIGLYAANAEWGPRPTRGTLAGFFLIQNAITALVVGLVFPSLVELVALVAGSAAGILLAPRLPVAATRLAVLGVSAVGGAALVLGAV